MLVQMLREFAWKWLACTLLPASVVAQLHAAEKYSTYHCTGSATLRLGTSSAYCCQSRPLRSERKQIPKEVLTVTEHLADEGKLWKTHMTKYMTT